MSVHVATDSAPPFRFGPWASLPVVRWRPDGLLARFQRRAADSSHPMTTWRTARACAGVWPSASRPRPRGAPSPALASSAERQRGL